MSTNITMPALSPTMEDGTLVKWFIKEGDTVSAGDVIAEIETDKATMEVEAVDEGIVGKILVSAGSEGVKVNSVLAVLLEDGEDASEISVDSAPSTPSGICPSTPTESQPTPSTPPVPPAPPSVPPLAKKQDGDRIFATPLARRLADEKGIDLASLEGSGPRGRIIKSDIDGSSA